MKSTRQIDIYITKKSNVRLIDVVQFDTGIHLVFTVKDFTIPSGATAKLYVQKPSGKFVFQEDGITIVDNTILIDLENQAITEHGKVPYQVSIVNGSDMITAFTGLMMVEKSLKDAGATESKTVIRAFDEVVSDHVAEFQAKAEQIVQACIATIPEDYTVMEAKVNDMANAVKGYLSGAVVVADDVSTVEHQPNVWVHGKNLLDTSKIAVQANTDNIYISAVGEGYIDITTKEAYDGNGHCVTWIKLKELCPQMQAGKQYALSGTTTAWNKMIYLKEIDLFWSYGTRQIVTEEMLECTIGFYGLNSIREQGFGTCRISNIQCEEGYDITDYTPYIDPSTVKVRRCGKNFWHSRDLSYPRTVSGVTINYDPNSQIYTFNGTSTAPGDIYTVPNGADIMHINAGETWTLKVELMGGTVDGVASCSGKMSPLVNNSDYTNTIHANAETLYSTKKYTEAADITKMYFYVYASGIVFNNFQCRIQFEPNNKPTEFEKFKELSEYIPAADGTVSGMTSLSPNMTILTDTEGVIVECEYNMDTKTYIDRKISELLKGSGEA